MALNEPANEIEPLLHALNDKFNALLEKQKHHDQLVRSLKTQLDIEGRGFRSIQEELEVRTQQWEEIKQAYDREILSLEGLERQSQREIQNLESQIRTLKGLERRVVCLIDGDGTIFSQELLALGEQGGHAAARELTRLILEHLKVNFAQSPSSPELSVYIFLHKRGLMDALGVAGYHNEKARFDDFVAGFNQAGQRFMMVDVGAGKENADSKLRGEFHVQHKGCQPKVQVEVLRGLLAFLQDSIRSPQTWKVFFGGSHDNGYAPDLQSLITDGFKEKLILLPGYTQIASRIADLGFPVLFIHGLFMPDKLPSFKPPPSRPSHFGLLPILDKTVEDSAEIRSVNSSPATPKSAGKQIGSPATPSKTKKGSKTKGPNPRECFTFHLIGSCAHGSECTNKHSPDLSPSDLINLANEAKAKTCTIKLKYGNCKYAAKCIHSHKCPKGLDCPHLKQNKCRFGPVEMH